MIMEMGPCLCGDCIKSANQQYAWAEEQIKKQIENQTQKADNDVPFTGEPGSHVTSPDGTKERVFGPDRLPDRDRHHTDHGNSKQHPYVPHDHDWVSKDGKWVPGPGYPSPDGPLVPRRMVPQDAIGLPDFDFSTICPDTGDHSLIGDIIGYIELFFDRGEI